MNNFIVRIEKTMSREMNGGPFMELVLIGIGVFIVFIGMNIVSPPINGKVDQFFVECHNRIKYDKLYSKKTPGPYLGWLLDK